MAAVLIGPTTKTTTVAIIAASVWSGLLNIDFKTQCGEKGKEEVERYVRVIETESSHVLY
jgi:hypothetical protein